MLCERGSLFFCCEFFLTPVLYIFGDYQNTDWNLENNLSEGWSALDNIVHFMTNDGKDFWMTFYDEYFNSFFINTS